MRLLRCRTDEGHAIVFHPRIKPPCASQGIPPWLRRHHPAMYRLVRVVQALEKHNRKVIDMRIHSDTQRHFREQAATASQP